MTKTSIKKFVIVAIAFIAIASALVIAGIFAKPVNGVAEAAATQKTLPARFSYTTSYSSNTSTYQTGAGANVLTARCRTGQYYYADISFTIMASMNYDGDFPSGGYICGSSATVSMPNDFNMTIKGANVDIRGKKSLTANNLQDGATYTVTVTGGGGWLVSGRQYDSVGFTCTFTFTVDNNKPSVSGASKNSSEIKKNSSFAVSANDSSSGVESLYMKAPNSNNYVAVNTSTTVNRGSANGLYSFYAVDRAGNMSDTYYVNFDDTPPVMECTGTNFGLSTNTTFTVSASDNYGTATLYYKFNEGEWKASGKSFTLKSTAEDGAYSFYAQDDFGNKTDTRTVQVGAELYGEFVKSDKDNTVYFTWERANWTATLDGKPYTKGAWITKEGEHTIKLSSGTKYAVYPYTIDHYYVEKIVDATCTKSGYFKYDCIQCGDTYSIAAAEETGHYYVASTVAPTCTDGGYTTYTCTRCGDSYKDNITHPLGHNYVPNVVSPKCTEGGYTLYSCSRCGSEYRSGSTEASGHNYVTKSVAATCTEGGYTLHECSRCGDNYKDNITQPLGHNFVISNTPATCTESGKTVYHCQVCEYERTESDGILPTGHNYTSSIVKEATCTQEGIRKYVCETCGDSYEVEIAAVGHIYEITDVQTNDDNTVRTYTCSVCGDSYTQELGNQYEEVTSYVEYLFQQYRPYMIWVFLATAGVWSIAIGVAIIVAHKNEDKEKAKKMLINYVIGIVIIFIILIAAPLLVRGIAALVT